MKDKFCTNCGQEIVDDSKFCNNCGNSLDGTSNPDNNNLTSKNKNNFLSIIIILLANILIGSIFSLAFPSTHTEIIGGHKFHIPSEFKSTELESIYNSESQTFTNKEGYGIRIMVDSGVLSTYSLRDYVSVISLNAAYYLGASRTTVNDNDAYTIENMNYKAYHIASGNDYILMDFDQEVPNKYELVQEIAKDL